MKARTHTYATRVRKLTVRESHQILVALGCIDDQIDVGGITETTVDSFAYFDPTIDDRPTSSIKLRYFGKPTPRKKRCWIDGTLQDMVMERLRYV